MAARLLLPRQRLLLLLPWQRLLLLLPRQRRGLLRLAAQSLSSPGQHQSLTSALLLQAMSHLVCLHYDTVLLPGYPAWYRGLRTVLSAIAIILLSSTAVMITPGNSSDSPAD
ncbi:unnamed protein product, partial [Lampetra fluviatilis]